MSDSESESDEPLDSTVLPELQQLGFDEDCAMEYAQDLAREQLEQAQGGVAQGVWSV